MGTDIHCAIERADYETGRWHFVEPLDLGRNYHLFGILAGVRCEHAPIVEPRGLPTDGDPRSCGGCCDCHDGRPCADPWLGDHTFSWLSLDELRIYDWNQLLLDECCIPLREIDRVFKGHVDTFYKETYVEWRKTPPHPPNGGCGGLSGAEVLDLRLFESLLAALSDPDPYVRERARLQAEQREIDASKAARYIADWRLMPEPEDPPPGALYVDEETATKQGYGWVRGKKYPRQAWARVAWTIAAKDACAEFHAWLTKQEASGADLRIVFGFDN